MNYYIDLIPTENFIEKIDEMNLKKSNIIFNMYVKQFPSMNTNKIVYADINECIKLAFDIKNRGYKINIMFDTFCFGNKEFTEKGKETLIILDKLLNLDIDFITVTNNFFFNYIKRRHKRCSVIMSEYAEITNVQKMTRFLEDIGADAVKIDTKLAKNLEVMEYVKNSFNINSIHIDTNKVCYKNDIYKDALNNSIAHYIQDENWQAVDETIEKYKKEQELLNNEEIVLNKECIEELKNKGYNNFWYYCNLEENEYIKKLNEKLT